jgi:two-component system, NarL family, response regulator DevR
LYGTLLTQDGDIEIVRESASAVARIPGLRPDVAMLDARCATATVSRCSGMYATSIRVNHWLILTSCDDDEALFAAILAGAAGYVLKQIRGTDLVDATEPRGGLT